MYRKIIYSTNLEVGQGKKVLITGASSGLGRELAIQFAQNGFIVYAVARRESELQETINLCIKAQTEEETESDVQENQSEQKHELNAQNTKNTTKSDSSNPQDGESQNPENNESDHRYFAISLTDSEQLQRFYDEIKDIEFEYVVLNAGVGFHGKRATLAETKSIMNLNLTAHAFLALNLHYIRLVSICSPQALFAMPNRSLYAASKAALHSLSLCIEMDGLADVTICYPRWFKSGLRSAAIGSGDQENKKGAPEASKIAQKIFTDVLEEKRVSCLKMTDKLLQIFIAFGGRFQALAEFAVKKKLS